MKKLNFLFWNIGGLSSYQNEIERVMVDNEIDVLILAEGTLVQNISLAHFVEVKLKLKNNIKKWIRVFYKDNLDFIITHKSEYTEVVNDHEDVVFENPNEVNKYIEVNRIQLFEISGSVQDTLFAGIHFPSKLYNDEITHTEIVPTYKTKIHSLAQKNDRLFIVGDFNMNPFDFGMIQPTCFNSHHNRKLILTDGHEHISGFQPLYYNPCWTLLGDFKSEQTFDVGKRSGGTHYFDEKRSRKLHWYMIDQIILRKALIEEFNSEYLKVVESETFITELLKPSIKVGNRKLPKLDHLPIRFSFNLKTK